MKKTKQLTTIKELRPLTSFTDRWVTYFQYSSAAVGAVRT